MPANSVDLPPGAAAKSNASKGFSKSTNCRKAWAMLIEEASCT